MTPDESVLEVNDLKMDNRDIRQGSMSNSVNNREVLLRSRIPVSSGSSWSRTMSGRWRDFASSSGTTESGRTSARQRSLSPNPAEQASGFKQKQKTGSGTSVIRWIKTMSGRWDSPRKTHHRRCSSGNPLYQTALSNVDEMDLDLSALHEESERVEAAARVNASVRQGDGDTPLRRSGYRNTRRDDEESLVEVMFHDITDSEAESDDEDLISESHISDFGSETLLEIATESHSDLTSNTRNRESSSSDNGELTDFNNNESSESDNDEPVNLNDNESSADATTRSFGDGGNSTPSGSAERRSSIATPQQSSISSGSQEEPSSIQSTNEILSTKIAQSHRLSCANESVDSQPNHSLNLGAEEQPAGWNEIPIDNESSSSSRRSSSMTSTTENERESCENYSLESGSDLSNISSEVAPVPVEMKGDGVQEHNTLSAYSHFLSSESSSQSLNSPESVVKWEKIPVMAVAPVEHKVTVDNVWDMVLGDASDDEDSLDDPLPPTALMTHVEQEVEGNVAIAKDLVSIAKQFETNGMWEQVGELCAAAVKSNLALRGPSADVLADALDGMAGASMALGDVVQAQVYFARSLHVRPVGAGGGKQLEAVTALCGLATAHSEQGQSEEAEERYLEAIQLCKSVRPFIAASESVEARSKPLVCLGDCYNHFALFLVDCDRYKEAQSIYNLALQSLRSYTEQVANTQLETNGFSKLAEVLHNMGDLFSDRGMYQRAFDSYDESLQIKRDLHGADHVSIAATLNNYSIALQECGRTIDAIERSEQALGMKIRILGPDHLEVAISENNWVDIQCAGKSQGLSSPLLASDNKSVLKRAKHALRVCLAHAGHGSLEVAFAQTACGQALALNESYDKAHKILTRSLNTHQSVKAAWGQSAIASVKHCLGMVCAKQGDIRGAKRNFEEALRIRDDRFGTDSFLANKTREALLQLRS